jgi:hypothetical protein
MRVSRRSFLAGTNLLLAGCAARRGSLRGVPAGLLPEARLARVRVSADRVIRTITGLRPYRPSGFVVRGEKRGDKTVIHNYGHGGGRDYALVGHRTARGRGRREVGSARLCGARLWRDRTIDRSATATSRLQSCDLRQGDAAAHDLECGWRVLGPGDVVRRSARYAGVPAAVCGSGQLCDPAISIVGGRPVWSAMATGVFAVVQRTDHACAARECVQRNRAAVSGDATAGAGAAGQRGSILSGRCMHENGTRC